jgi:hypothetical protein
MKAHLSPNQAALDAMSAYLDGRLTKTETAELERQLQANPEWRAAMDELAAIRSLLRSLPVLRAPRNLILAPAAMPHPRRRNFPSLAYGFGSALAAVAAVLVFALGSISAPMAASAPAAMAQRAVNSGDLPTGTSAADSSGPFGAVPVAATSASSRFAALASPPTTDTETPATKALALATAAPNYAGPEASGCGACEPGASTISLTPEPATNEATPSFVSLLPMTENQAVEKSGAQPSFELPATTIAALLLGIGAIAFAILSLRSRRRR